MEIDDQAYRAAAQRQWDAQPAELQAFATAFWDNIRRQEAAGRVFAPEEFVIEYLEYAGFSSEEARQRYPDVLRAWAGDLRSKLS